jgi:hypothetical protein
MGGSAPLPFISFIETPAHNAIAPTESALRILLDAPDDLPLVQWQLSPLVQVSRHLVGGVWQLVGHLVPHTEDHPGYPYMQYPDDPRTHLQAWLWRVFKPPPHHRHPRPMPLGWNRPWGDLRWHPTRGLWVTMELRPSDDETVARQVWRWIHATELAAAGPPLGDACPWTREQLLQEIRAAIASVRRHRDYPSDARIWEAMGRMGDHKTLVRWCMHRGIDMQAVKRER